MSSAGDPATRLVVDLAAYQPIEEGVNLSIHNVRLQQICVAKKRRRFLRRRPPAGDAANGSNHIQKEGILIIGELSPPHARTGGLQRNAVDGSKLSDKVHTCWHSRVCREHQQRCRAAPACARAGTDRFVFGMVGEQDAQLPNKEKERQERAAARQKLLEEKSAARQQRVEVTFLILSCSPLTHGMAPQQYCVALQ